MIDYMKKRASIIDMPLLRYAIAFSEGALNTRCGSYKDKNVCPKIL